jgi:hypothetical protein
LFSFFFVILLASSSGEIIDSNTGEGDGVKGKAKKEDVKEKEDSKAKKIKMVKTDVEEEEAGNRSEPASETTSNLKINNSLRDYGSNLNDFKKSVNKPADESNLREALKPYVTSSLSSYSLPSSLSLSVLTNPPFSFTSALSSLLPSSFSIYSTSFVTSVSPVVVDATISAFIRLNVCEKQESGDRFILRFLFYFFIF